MAVTDQDDVLVHDRFDDVAQGIGIDRRKNRADRHAAAVGGNQNRNLLGRQAALARLPAAATRLAIKVPLALAAFRHVGFVGLDDAGKLSRIPASGGKEPVPPAEGRADGKPATHGGRAHRFPVRETGPEFQPSLLAVRPANGVPVAALNVFPQPSH